MTFSLSRLLRLISGNKYRKRKCAKMEENSLHAEDMVMGAPVISPQLTSLYYFTHCRGAHAFGTALCHCRGDLVH